VEASEVGSISNAAEEEGRLVDCPYPVSKVGTVRMISLLLRKAKIPRAFAYTYLLVILYALSFQIVSPTQLYLVKSLTSEGEAATQFALIRTVNGVAQLVGSLISGALIDRYGYRFVMLISLVSSAVCYFLMAIPTEDKTTALWLLYLAQIPTLAQHAILAGRAFISLGSLPDRRAVLLGYIGVCYGIGVVLGPMAGGLMSKSDLRFPAVVATILSLISIAIAVVAPREVRREGKGQEKEGAGGASVAAEAASQGQNKKAADNNAASSQSALSKYLTFFTTPILALRLGQKLLFSFSLALFYSVFALIVADRFGLDSAGAGVLQSFFGFVGVLVQGLLLAFLKARYTEATICVASGAVLAASFAALCFLSTAVELYVIAIPLVISSTLFQSINSSQVAEATPDSLKGTAVALDMSLFSALRLVTPGLGAWLLKSVGYASIGASSSASALVLLALMVLFPKSVEGGVAAPVERGDVDKTHAE
jgi:MFS transporter, OCT family, solute carrier family 22 (organic cation transporter), member 18